MQLFLDVGFVLSLLLLAIGLERIAFRPHQRRRIQTFFEELTIKVDDLNPVAITVQLGNSETVRLLALVTYFWFCVIIIGSLFVTTMMMKIFNISTLNHDMLLSRSVVCGISSMLLSRWPVPKFLKYAISSNPTRNRLAIIATVLFYGGSVILIVAILATQKLVMGQIQITQPSTIGPWTQSGLIELAFWPAYVLMWLSVAPITLALTTLHLPSLARKIIVPLAGLLWRLVEYEKGALSALILFTAFILGVLKLLYGS